MRWERLRRKKVGLAVASMMICLSVMTRLASGMAQLRQTTGSKPLTWVDFGVTAEAMTDALEYDIASRDTDCPIDWIDLLACLGARYGGDFHHYQKKHMEALAQRLQGGESIESVTADMKYYDYYSNAYQAVLGGLAGEYSLQTEESLGSVPVFAPQYGLKGYAPIAQGYSFSHSDDFCAARSFGFKREHLGHDLFGVVGTPVINVETCTVQVLGWNRYGGWRIGMRSLDGRRYYYYAHLRSGHPYAKGLQEGKLVYAGEVIGYMGMTGYSDKEDFNGMQRPHLHFGIQLIFDEASRNEIWIDTYELVKFLNRHRSTVENHDGEFTRRYRYYETTE